MNYNYDAFRQRLKAALNGESINSFAKRCGFAESGLRKYLKEDSLPGTDRLVTISEAAGVNIKWLATGDGPMRTNVQTATTASPVSTTASSHLDTLPAGALPEEIKISEMITKTVEVLESDTIYRTALASNINAFHHSINMIAQIDRLEGTVVRVETDSKETKSRINSMEEQMNTLLEKINNLEKTAQVQDCDSCQEVVNGH